jgi:hypothetical protein
MAARESESDEVILQSNVLEEGKRHTARVQSRTGKLTKRVKS